MSLPRGYVLDDQGPQASGLPAGYSLDEAQDGDSTKGPSQSPDGGSSFASKAWDALKVPEEMSRSGLQQISEALKPSPEYTGNLPRDIAMNYPSFSADVLSKVAPGFLSRGALLTAGASKALQAAAPLAGAMGSGIAGQVESLTGARPGSLRSAWNDASTMFSSGKQAAKPLYKAAQAEMAPGESVFAGMYKPGEIVDAAQAYLAKGGQLEPAEALTYRKALDKLINSQGTIKDPLYEMRSTADAAAKASPNVAQADPLYQKGLYGESLRNLMPQNKYGGTSAFKAGIMAALSQMGTPGKAALGLMSPAAAGATATIGGLASRGLGSVATNPALTTAIQQLIAHYYSQNATNQDGTSQPRAQVGAR